MSSKFFLTHVYKKISALSLFQEKWVCVSIYFGIWLAMGLILYSNYGISIDEPTERITGIVNINYIGEKLNISTIANDPVLKKYGDIRLEQYHDRIYGPLFAEVSVALERVFNIGNGINEKKIFQFRHLLTFLISLIGGYAIFRLSERWFNNWKIGLLTLTFFIFSPRFFADSFYNNKDLIFLSLFAISLNTLIIFINHPNLKNSLLHGVATALAIATRNIGISLILITFSILLIQAIDRKVTWLKFSINLISYFILVICITILIWPWLWSAPIDNFLIAIKAFSGWTRVTAPVTFLGQSIQSALLPWYYLPIWIVITTPIFYLFIFGIGIVSTLHHFIKRKFLPWSNRFELADTIFFCSFFCPLIAIASLHSPIYDGWRHLYFIYPAFLLLATKGWVILWGIIKNNAPLKKIILGILFFNFIYIGIWMIQANPLQNVYFNILAGTEWKKNFDVDYWGLSNRLALTYITQHDHRALIKIYPGSTMALPSSIKILKPSDKARFIIVDWEGDADYVLTNYRSNLTDYSSNGKPFSLWHQIKVSDEVIASVFKRNQDFPPSENIYINERINFSTTGKGRNFLLGMGRSPLIGWGWGFSEAWGTWTDGGKAKFILPYPALPATTIQFEMIPFVTPSHSKQTIEIWIDGYYQSTFVLVKNEINYIEVPAPTKPNDRNFIELELFMPDKVRPKDLGLSEDSRELGVGLVSITFLNKHQ